MKIAWIKDEDSAPVVAAARLLDLISADEAVTWASRRIDSSDPESMIILATQPFPADKLQVDDALRELAEAEGQTLTDATARRLMARHVALSILSGSIDPYSGARAIWGLAAQVADQECFAPFIGAASGWEDEPDYRSEYEQDIIAAAKDLVKDRTS